MPTRQSCQLEELTGSTRESFLKAAAPGGVRVHGRMVTAVQRRTRCARLELMVPHRAGGIHRRPVGVSVRQNRGRCDGPTRARSWYAMGKPQLSYARLISVPAMSAWVRLVVIRAKISSRVLLRES